MLQYDTGIENSSYTFVSMKKKPLKISKDIKLGECGTFFGGPGYGFWYSYSCNLLAYPICQKARDPDAYTPRPDRK